MKLPSFETAASALSALTGLGPTIGAAAGAVKLIVGLFDDKPEQQNDLKALVEPAFAAANASLDRLEDAIDEAQAKD